VAVEEATPLIISGAVDLIRVGKFQFFSYLTQSELMMSIFRKDRTQNLGESRVKERKEKLGSFFFLKEEEERQEKSLQWFTTFVRSRPPCFFWVVASPR
jgi:hypothetical protein